MITKEWIDAHAHLTDNRLVKVLPALLATLAQAGVSQFVLGGIDPDEWEEQKRLAQMHPGKFFQSFGLHPWWVSAASSEELGAGLAKLRLELADPKRACLAIGETGLDHHPKFSKDVHPVQATVFRAHLRLAFEFNLPLVLHIVRAHEEALSILREESRIASGKESGSYSGIVHSFSGDPVTARAYLALGLTPSISAPVLTRGKGSAFEKLRQTVVTLGATEFVLETDSPDQPPAGETGINSPLTLLRIADEIAVLRHTTREAILDQSRDTVRRIFRIP